MHLLLGASETREPPKSLTLPAREAARQEYAEELSTTIYACPNERLRITPEVIAAAKDDIARLSKLRLASSVVPLGYVLVSDGGVQDFACTPPSLSLDQFVPLPGHFRASWQFLLRREHNLVQGCTNHRSICTGHACKVDRDARGCDFVEGFCAAVDAGQRRRPSCKRRSGHC